MSADQRITRLEIAEAVSTAFGSRGATRDEIVAAASMTNRDDVVDVLSNLPDRRYIRLNDLWEELRDVPVGA